MCGHGSNPGPGHPRPAAVNRTDPDQGRRRTHTSPERAPHVWSILQVVRSGPQPSRFAPDAARTIPARSPNGRKGPVTAPLHERDFQLDFMEQAWPGTPRVWPQRWPPGSRVDGKRARGGGRVPAFSGEDNRRRPDPMGRSPRRPPCPQPRPRRSGTAFTTIVHRHPYCISIVQVIGDVCRHNTALNNGLFVAHMEKEESPVTPRVEGVFLLSRTGRASDGGEVMTTLTGVALCMGHLRCPATAGPISPSAGPYGASSPAVPGRWITSSR